MNRILKITSIIVLEIVIIALLLGLASGTIWLFHKGANSNWSTWMWISVLFEGIGALVFIPVWLMLSLTFTKDKIRKIKEENK